MNWKNHYKYLEAHLWNFLEKVGINPDICRGIIVAHGDKCSQYRDKFEHAGLAFHRGAAIYILTYLAPFSKEVRETRTGWVDPADWVIANKAKFVPILKEIEDAYLDLVTEKLANRFLGEKLPVEIIDFRDKEVLIPHNKVITKKMLRKMVPCLEYARTDYPTPIGRILQEIWATIAPKP